MTRFLIFIGLVVGGYLGWWAGEYFEFGLSATFLVSSLGSVAGVFLGWKMGRDYFEG